MNQIRKLKLDIESLLDIVNSDQQFFSSISSYINKLNLVMDSDSVDIEELEFLMVKVEAFYKKYRSKGTSGVIYIPPKQTSNSDSIVKEILEIIRTIKNKEPDDVKKEFEEAKGADLNIEKNDSCLNLNDKKLYNSCKTAFESEDYWNFVFNATRHLEIRIREKAKLSATDVGIELVSKAFSVSAGCLKIPSCETAAEDEGFFHILRGIVMFHRNAKGHREGLIEKERALQIVNYVDYLIDMIESAVRMSR